MTLPNPPSQIAQARELLSRLRSEAGAAGDTSTVAAVNAVLGVDANGFTVHANAAGRARSARKLRDAPWLEGSQIPAAVEAIAPESGA